MERSEPPPPPSSSSLLLLLLLSPLVVLASSGVVLTAEVGVDAREAPAVALVIMGLVEALAKEGPGVPVGGVDEVPMFGLTGMLGGVKVPVVLATVVVDAAGPTVNPRMLPLLSTQNQCGPLGLFADRGEPSRSTWLWISSGSMPRPLESTIFMPSSCPRMLLGNTGSDGGAVLLLLLPLLVLLFAEAAVVAAVTLLLLLLVVVVYVLCAMLGVVSAVAFAGAVALPPPASRLLRASVFWTTRGTWSTFVCRSAKRVTEYCFGRACLAKL